MKTTHPLSVIVRHFDSQPSEYTKKYLWELLKAAVSEASLTYLNKPGTAATVERDIGRLMDALWLMLYEKETTDGEIKLLEYSKGSDGQTFSELTELSDLYPILNLYQGRIRRLSQSETESPYLALKSFFQFHNLEQWKEVLAVWKEYALTNSSVVEVYDEHLFLPEYEQLEKMIEVAFLFNKESESRFYCDDDAYLEKLINEFNNRGKQKVTKPILKNFFDLLHAIPPERLGRNLRIMTLQFIETNTNTLPKDFGIHLADFNKLTAFLDLVSDEINSNRRCTL